MLFDHRPAADRGPEDRRFLERGTELLSKRAPDGVDTHRVPPVTMVKTLLHTGANVGCDTNAGLIRERGLMLAADVRLDDRRELANGLQREGFEMPRQATDDQWVAAAWRAWGSRSPAYLRGDFAFVVWEPSSGTLAAARDPFGIRPLYFAEVSSGVLLSNSLGPILAHPALSREKDPVGVLDYLLFDSNYEPTGTVWKGIRRVPPGHVMIWQGKERRQVPYGQPWVPSAESLSPEERIEDFRGALRDAVRARVRDGESVAISMSGGLDSTSLAAMACESGLRPRAHTLVYERAIVDQEGNLAAQAADFLGIDHRRWPMDDYPLFERWHELPWSPMPGDPMVDAIYHDFDLGVLQDSRVVLTGWGGDPLLLPERGLWRRRLAAGRPDLAWLDIWRSLRATGKWPPLGLHTAWEKRRSKRHWRQGFPSWLNPDFARDVDALNRWRRRVPGLKPRDSSQSGTAHRPEAVRYTFDLQWSHVFERVDAGNRGLPLERRHPFFDQRVVDRALSAPTSPWCIDKHLLRRAMQNRLPRSVLERPKSPQVGDPRHPEGRPLHELLATWLQAAPEIERYIQIDVLIDELKQESPRASGDRRQGLSVSAAWRRPLNFAAWAARLGES